MNYNSNIVSLEQMALIKTAIELWNQNDIKVLMRIFYKSLDLDTTAVNYLINWGNLENVVNRKVNHLSQPRLFEEKIKTFIKTVGSQIRSWLDYHRFLILRLDLPKEFCWTLHGTIDAKKTAEVFVKDSNLDVSTRFKLACVYCLEEDISSLWKELPENFNFCQKISMRCRIGLGQHGLVVFWISVMKNELHGIFESSSTDPHQNQYAFEIAVKIYNIAAIEYFMKKLTPSQMEESLHRFLRHASPNSFWCEAIPYREIRADVLLFFLSELGERGKTEIFRKHGRVVLHCFLHWPRQCLFMEAAGYAMEFLHSLDFIQLLHHITLKIRDSKDYNYRELFSEFWKQSKDSHKKYAILGCGFDDYKLLRPLLFILFSVGDTENIRLVFKSMTESQRERVIFSEKGKEICEILYSDSKWDLLKFFIAECIPTKNSSLKEELEAYVNVKENSNKFFQLIDLVCKDLEKDTMSK